MGRIRCFAVEMARRGRAGGITNLRFLIRPRRLETRTERGFPHFPSNGGYCSLAHLKRQARQNRGVRQILAQNQKKRVEGCRPVLLRVSADIGSVSRRSAILKYENSVTNPV